MPNPKTGTVTTDVGRAVSEFKGGKVEYRTDRYGNVHVQLGKVSFEQDKLDANFRAVLDEVQRAKPASAKGRYLRKITISLDDGPRRPRRHQPPQARHRIADQPLAGSAVCDRWSGRIACPSDIQVLLAEDRWSIDCEHQVAG